MRPAILDRVEDLGHVVFESGVYNLNLIGQRTKGRVANQFDDLLHVIWRDDVGSEMRWKHLVFECTTDPGAYYLESPINMAGTAIMVPGQYRSCYKVGLHRGKPALVQSGGRVSVYRDSDRDNIIDIDPDTVDTGYFGINIHQAGADSQRVHRWSAGCTVIANELDWHIFYSIVSKSASIWGDVFTYTLIED